MASVFYIGHAGFVVEAAGRTLVFDPWIEGNPRCALRAVDELDRCDVLFVSHDHRDHGFAEAPAICRGTGAVAVGVFELVKALEARGVARTCPANIGGRVQPVEGVESYITPALHSCERGVPCGFVVRTDELTVYHAGDTGYSSEMAVLGEMFSIDLALLPIGSTYTMGPEEAAMAVEALKPRWAVPMHYGTFPAIDVDPRAFADAVERGGSGARVRILEVGERWEVPD